MAVLGSRSVTRIAVAAAAAALSACVILSRLVPGERKLAFSHHRHVAVEKLECANCHADALASDRPGLPSPDTCQVCHADVDPGKAPERRADTLSRDGTFVAARVSALADAPRLRPLEILKIVAVVRLVLPRQDLKVAGGRAKA